MTQMMEVYIPIDRRHALARGAALPERTDGAALFADISGFTPLTEALTRALGPRQGAEELTRQLNLVYDALVDEVHRYRGSVLGFAGDAITCWFADDVPESIQPSDDKRLDPALPRAACLRATTCGLAMQQAMLQFAAVPIPGGGTAELAMKAAVASGPVRRFLVGDPAIQCIDALAGETLVRMAAAEHLAERGDVVVDAQTVECLGEQIEIAEWRTDEETGARFAVVRSVASPAPPSPWPPLTTALDEARVRPWLLPPVYQRLGEGLGEFLAELRPVVVLFLCFGGIDYDRDPDAGVKLDAFIRWAQGVVTRYRGTLLQLIIGDKGSYIYATFGAPLAFEDVDRRAATAALELHTLPADLDFVGAVEIGISQGTMLAGAYGGTARRTYGVLGDEVNLAARLMQHAGPEETLVSGRAHQYIAEAFAWEQLQPIRVKGKAAPIPVWRLVGQQRAWAAGMGLLHRYPHRLVGREDELDRFRSVLAQAVAGGGQILRLEGRTGIGKSHLVAEFAAQAIEQGIQVTIGPCQSTSQHVAYVPWRAVFRALLGLDGGALDGDAEAAAAKQVARLEQVVAELNPDWRVRLPLLGDLLDLPIPDNATTAAFDPRLRQEALFTLAIELVERYARAQPLLLLIEDIHWMDEVSLGLTLALGRVVDRFPVMLLLTHRPPVGEDEALLPDLNRVSHCHQLSLDELSLDSVAALVVDRLGAPLSPLALSLIQNQALGNPFFAEELVGSLGETGNLVQENGTWVLSRVMIDALREANCVAKDAASGEWLLCSGAQLSSVSMGIPDSVHGAVLSRLDRLPESHKLTLKVASVIGRVFELQVLAQSHPTGAGEEELRAQQETLAGRDFVQLESPPPREAYLFKHSVTQEVVYETLPGAQQRELHRAVGTVLEAIQQDAVEQLAYHFRRGGAPARDKAIIYLDRAARKAQREYANETALNYYSQALSLEDRWEWRKGQIEVLHILGRREEQQRALESLGAMPDAPAYEVAYLWGRYYEAVSDYVQAQTSIERALAASRKQADQVSEVNSLAYLGLIARRQGDFEIARSWYQQALSLFHEDEVYSSQEATAFAEAFNGLGIVHRQQASFEEARMCYEQALAMSQRSGNRAAEARALNSIGGTAYYQRNYAEAMGYYRRALDIWRAIGGREGEGVSLLSLAQMNVLVGDYEQAEKFFSMALAIQQAIGNRWEEVNIWNGLGVLYHELGDLAQAQQCGENGLQLSQEIGDEDGQATMLSSLGLIARDRGDLGLAEDLLTESLALAQTLDNKYLISILLSYLSTVHLLAGRFDNAVERANAALAMRRELGLELYTADDLATLAAAHLGLADAAIAVDYAQQSLHILDECGGEGPEFPHRDYFVCYQVFAAAGQTDAAHAALRSAHELVVARADRITDPSWRESFLTHVPANRAIIQEWETVA
jgi:adenylate cyclase